MIPLTMLLGLENFLTYLNGMGASNSDSPTVHVISGHSELQSHKRKKKKVVAGDHLNDVAVAEAEAPPTCLRNFHLTIVPVKDLH